MIKEAYAPFFENLSVEVLFFPLILLLMIQKAPFFEHLSGEVRYTSVCVRVCVCVCVCVCACYLVHSFLVFSLFLFFPFLS